MKFILVIAIILLASFGLASSASLGWSIENSSINAKIEIYSGHKDSTESITSGTATIITCPKTDSEYYRIEVK